MKILILSQYYAPEPTVRAHELAASLCQRGHEVTAITGFPNYPYGRVYDGYKMHVWQREKRDGVSIIRLPLFPDHSRSVFRRSLYYSSFAVSASLLGPILGGGADAMYVYFHPPTIGIAAAILSFFRDVPYVVEVQDIWPESLAATQIVSQGPLVTSLKRFERFTYKRSAAVVTISPGFRNNLISKGVPAEKIHVISNWSDDSTHCPVPPNTELAEALGMSGHFNVLYTGNMGPAQALENVVQAAQYLQDLPNVQFVLAGDGVDKADLEAMLLKKNLRNVRFVGRQPLERIRELTALADVLLVHLRCDPLFTITIPSKTIDYLASGKPILCAAPGDTNDLVSGAKAGLGCEAQNPLALANVVRQFYAMSSEARVQMGKAGRRAFLQHYSRDVLVQDYEDLLFKIANSSATTKEPLTVR